MIKSADVEKHSGIPEINREKASNGSLTIAQLNSKLLLAAFIIAIR